MKNTMPKTKATRPTPELAAALASQYSAPGVAVLMLTTDGRVAFSHSGLTRYLGPPSGWLGDDAVRWVENNLRGLLEGTLELESDEGDDEDDDEADAPPAAG